MTHCTVYNLRALGVFSFFTFSYLEIWRYSQMNKPIFTGIALLTVYLVWGSTFLGNQLGLEGGLPPLFLVGTRFLLAGLLLYGVARWNGESRGTWKEWKEAFLLGFLLLVCGPGLVAWSQQWLSSSLAALLIATSPVWVTLLDGDEKLTRTRWLGLMLGLLGVATLVGSSLVFSGENVLLGAAACLFSALAWAVGSIRAKKRSESKSWMFYSGQQMMLAGGVLSLLSYLGGEAVSLSTVEFKAWLALGYLTVFGSLVAYGAYTWLITNVSSATLSSHAYINPIVAVFLGIYLGGENVSPYLGSGALLGLLGVVLLLKPNGGEIGFWKRGRSLP